MNNLDSGLISLIWSIVKDDIYPLVSQVIRKKRESNQRLKDAQQRLGREVVLDLNQRSSNPLYRLLGGHVGILMLLVLVTLPFVFTQAWTLPHPWVMIVISLIMSAPPLLRGIHYLRKYPDQPLYSLTQSFFFAVKHYTCVMVVMIVVGMLVDRSDKSIEALLRLNTLQNWLTLLGWAVMMGVEWPFVWRLSAQQAK